MCISFTSFTRTCHLVGRSWGAFVSSGIPGVWRWGQRRRWLCLPPPGKVPRRVAPGALAADLPSQWSSPQVLPTLHCQETGSGRALGLSEQAGSPWSPGHSQGCQWKRGRSGGGNLWHPLMSLLTPEGAWHTGRPDVTLTFLCLCFWCGFCKQPIVGFYFLIQLDKFCSFLGAFNRFTCHSSW